MIEVWSKIVALDPFEIIIALVCLGSFFSLLALVRLSQRIKRLSQLMKSFEQGEYSKRLATTGTDAFGQIETGFNRLADRLTADVQVTKMNDELRRELLANISHDLRSPLTSLVGYLETISLKDRVLSFETRKDYLDVALQNAKQLLKLVTDLFELSRVDARAHTAVFEPFSLEELAGQMITKFLPRAQQKQIDLTLIVPSYIPRTLADIAMLERALSNILENSICYTKPGGKVVMTLREEMGQVVVEIADTGIGIPEQDLPYVCDRFYRVHKERPRSSGGAGLGLAITKRILESHGSSIEIVSREKRGTTVSFQLKAVQEQALLGTRDNAANRIT